ncbi:EF-hand domain-containing protein [Paraburkholderia humisilvae]|uniref:EF-hand domain-containing protein n=1 Tax=Paraburkholderia humisilvae TaxID=627669 RepID=A0A6J5DEG3_9BURK|nr:EF-hand domain-containing protein [Paraburkholderia humisilvae]CAB3752558.1 hypothetical protein LMG29542_01809 [Paraburkholderia humisilvae]
MSVSLINSTVTDLLHQSRDRNAANTADTNGSSDAAVASGAAGAQAGLPNGSQTTANTSGTNSPSSIETFSPAAQMLSQWASEGLTIARFSLLGFGLTPSDVNNAEQSKQGLLALMNKLEVGVQNLADFNANGGKGTMGGLAFAAQFLGLTTDSIEEAKQSPDKMTALLNRITNLVPNWQYETPTNPFGTPPANSPVSAPGADAAAPRASSTAGAPSQSGSGDGPVVGGTVSAQDFTRLVEQFGGSADEAKQLFAAMDTDQNGSLSNLEVVNELGRLSTDSTSAVSQMVMALMDTDHNGNVSGDEFFNFQRALQGSEKAPT